MPREYTLHKARTALGRSAGQPPAPVPPPRIRIPEIAINDRIASFAAALEKLGGRVYLAESAAAARDYVASAVTGRSAVASNGTLLSKCGISSIPGVRTVPSASREELRAACAAADVGITGADYALADTGSVVLFSSPEEARMVSLLPPAHIAVVERGRLLTGLDELFSIVPQPADLSSSMVLITGPSRTADIEQILVRGVHGPGEIHAVIV